MEQAAWDPEEFRGRNYDSDEENDSDEGPDDDEPEYGSRRSEGGRSTFAQTLTSFDDVCFTYSSTSSTRANRVRNKDQLPHQAGQSMRRLRC